MSAEEAELAFLIEISCLPEYGVLFYKVSRVCNLVLIKSLMNNRAKSAATLLNFLKINLHYLTFNYSQRKMKVIMFG